MGSVYGIAMVFGLGRSNIPINTVLSIYTTENIIENLPTVMSTTRRMCYKKRIDFEVRIRFDKMNEILLVQICFFTPTVPVNPVVPLPLRPLAAR